MPTPHEIIDIWKKEIERLEREIASFKSAISIIYKTIDNYNLYINSDDVHRGTLNKETDNRSLNVRLDSDNNISFNSLNSDNSSLNGFLPSVSCCTDGFTRMRAPEIANWCTSFFTQSPSKIIRLKDIFIAMQKDGKSVDKAYISTILSQYKDRFTYDKFLKGWCLKNVIPK